MQYTGRKEDQEIVRRGGERTEVALTSTNKSKKKKEKKNLLSKKVGHREHRTNAKQRGI